MFETLEIFVCLRMLANVFDAKSTIDSYSVDSHWWTVQCVQPIYDIINIWINIALNF